MDNILHLSTLDTVFLIITAVAVSLFFIIGSFLLIAGLFLVSKVKKLVTKAESAIDSVEEATDTLRHIGQNAGGPLAVFKIIKAIVEIANKRH